MSNAPADRNHSQRNTPDLEPPRSGAALPLETSQIGDQQAMLQTILQSPSYAAVENDAELLRRPELRSVRLMLEFLKPELALKEADIDETVVVFGGTSIVEPGVAQARLEAARAAAAAAPTDPLLERAVGRAERVVAKSPWYNVARQFARMISEPGVDRAPRQTVVVTGGGPGIMEAANRGAADVGAPSVGLNIRLPAEQWPNPYITPKLCFQFHYFAMRKMHFLLRARALVVFPGGFGTIDELFDALTLRQTRRMQAIPIVLVSRDYWRQAIDFEFLANEGVIADADLKLITYCETPEEIVEAIRDFPAEGATR